jgi:predicted transposase/invertase (TIGR01784 family)
MKFLDVKTDYAFKKVFGTLKNKPILIEFLNSLITFSGNHKVKDLTTVDPYNIPMLKWMKDTFVDVKAVLDNDTKVIIEMQVLNYHGFEKRVLYNAVGNYSVQLKKSDDYHLLNTVIALSIVDFDMFEENKNVITNFKLLEKKRFINYSGDIELIFIELPKFNKELAELEDITDQWLYFVKNAGDLDLIPHELNHTINWHWRALMKPHCEVYPFLWAPN